MKATPLPAAFDDWGLRIVLLVMAISLALILGVPMPGASPQTGHPVPPGLHQQRPLN